MSILAKHNFNLISESYLLDYQLEHTKRLVWSLYTHGVAFDGSDTGTGKTYTTAAAALDLNAPVFVISPKSVIESWRRVLTDFNVEILGIENVELVRLGKMAKYRESKRKHNGEYRLIRETTNCPYVNPIPNAGIYDYKFSWHNMPRGTIIVIDEAHMANNWKTANAQIVQAAKHACLARGYRLLLLSATLAKTPLDMSATGFALGLFPRRWDFKAWAIANGCSDWGYLTYDAGADGMKKIHHQLYSTVGSRMRISEIKDFPDTTIIAEPIDLGVKATNAIREQHSRLFSQISELSQQEKRSEQVITKILRVRQKIELSKVLPMVDLIKEALNDGYSVVVFTNFQKTMNHFMDLFKTKCVVRGGQDADERNYYVERFQQNKEPLIIVNIQSGAQSISLHDEITQKPRMVFLCPTFWAEQFKQAIGRSRRAKGGRSIQKIIFAANTYEEKICNVVRRKIQNIDTLNDYDLQGDFF